MIAARQMDFAGKIVEETSILMLSNKIGSLDN